MRFKLPPAGCPIPRFPSEMERDDGSMSRTLLSAEEFGRAVAARARKTWPEFRVRAMGRLLLRVEPRLGDSLFLSLVHAYQAYCDCPEGEDAVIRTFLYTALDRIVPEPLDFTVCRERLLPQIVPLELLASAPDLVAIPYVGDLAVAFVLDEPARYCYIHQQLLDEWGITEPTLLATAIGNLQRLGRGGPGFNRIGTGAQAQRVWGLFDGYDASRVLLTSELEMMALEVPGTPVIIMPHQDHLVVFGDSDPEFVRVMIERMRHEYTTHSCRISMRLYTLSGGQLAIYTGSEERQRLVN